MEVINEKLRQIKEQLDELVLGQKDMTRLVAEHEKWIYKREGELEILDDRFRMLEQQVSDHQSYIDERKGTFRELEAMKSMVVEHHTYITHQKGEKQGIGDLITKWGTLAGLAVTLLKLFGVF